MPDSLLPGEAASCPMLPALREGGLCSAEKGLLYRQSPGLPPQLPFLPLQLLGTENRVETALRAPLLCPSTSLSHQLVPCKGQGSTPTPRTLAGQRGPECLSLPEPAPRVCVVELGAPERNGEGKVNVTWRMLAILLSSGSVLGEGWGWGA